MNKRPGRRYGWGWTGTGAVVIGSLAIIGWMLVAPGLIRRRVASEWESA